MRILYLCLDQTALGTPNGSGRHVVEMLRAFEAEGHSTAVAAQHVDPSYVNTRPTFSLVNPDTLGPSASLRSVADRTDRFPFAQLVGLAREIRQVRKGSAISSLVDHSIETFSPDLIYERAAIFRTEGVRAAQRASIWHVLEVNTPLVEEARLFRELRLRSRATECEVYSWTSTDLVVTSSPALDARVRDVGQSATLVVPISVDPELFRPVDVRDSVRRELQIQDRFVIGFVSSMNPWHDVETVARGVAGLPAESRPALLAVGDGPERPRLEDLASATGLELCATGAVPQREVPRLLAATDACVVGLKSDPRLDYASPIKALEYLAAGKPTIVAEAGVLPQLVRDGVALGFEPGNAAQLSERLLTVWNQPEEAARLRRCGLDYASRHTWQEAARKVLHAVKLAEPQLQSLN